MSVKKRVIGLVVVLAMVVVMTTLGSNGVFAESSVLAQPMETVKSIEVELNDNYFNPMSSLFQMEQPQR